MEGSGLLIVLVSIVFLCIIGACLSLEWLQEDVRARIPRQNALRRAPGAGLLPARLGRLAGRTAAPALIPQGRQ